MSEINNTKELSEIMFPIKFKTIDQYQQKYSAQMSIFKAGK